MPEPRFMTVGDMQSYIGKSRSWVYEAARTGAIPSYRIGASIKFDQVEIDKWVRAQRVRSSR